MLHLPLSSGLRPFLLTLLILGSAGALQSQPTDGSTLQEKPGVALIKPQAWSKESEATLYEFQGYFDRSTSGAGYYEFRKAGVAPRQVPTSRIVKLIIYPDPASTKEMVSPADRQKLLAAIDDLKNVRAKFPAAATYLDPSVKKLNDELAQYDNGKVKQGGVWISKSSYDSEKATNLINLLKADVANTDPPSTLDFASDPKVVALTDLGKTNDGIKKSLDEITATYNKALRKEKRGKILTRLAAPSMPLAEAQTAIAQLKSLQPEEDPKCALFVKSWDTGAATLAATAAQASTLAPLLEKELAAAQVTDAPPKLSPDLDKQISALNDTLRQFIAAKPAPQLVAASGRALAVGSTGAGFTRLRVLFTNKQFLDAREITDDLARQAHQVGPETVRVVGTLQAYTSGKIKEFTSVREEAKLLADAGKPADALVKYQAAYDLIPDTAVGDAITQLKQALPDPSPKKK